MTAVMTALRTPRAGAAGVLAVLALAACSSPSAPAPASSSANLPSAAVVAPPPSPSPSAAAPAGLEAASADEILAEARAALLRASSVHAKGRLLSGGTSYRIDLRLVRGKGATGTMAVEGKGLALVRIGGTAYVQPDAAFLQSATNSASAVRLLQGTWFRVTARKTAAFAPFVALTDVSQAFGGALAPTGTVRKGTISKLGRQRVIDLVIDGGKGGHVVVALTGTPYPLRIIYPGRGDQRVDLDSFGARIKLTPPPAAKVKSVPGF
jgi:hypothetical protein